MGNRFTPKHLKATKQAQQLAVSKNVCNACNCS